MEKVLNGFTALHNGGDGTPMSPEVPKLLLTVDENNVIDGAKEVLKVIRPLWQDGDCQFKIFTDGITNKLVGCFYENSQKDVVLVRVYGNNTDLLIDRKAETRNFKLLNSFGYAPKLYATFRNGLVYEYVPGNTLTTQTVVDPKIWPLVARQMARMHRIDLELVATPSKEPILESKMAQFLSLVPEVFTDPKKHKRVQELFPSLSDLKHEFSELFEQLKELGSPTVFSHNDLLLGNIIYTDTEDRVTFIDYEYAGCNYQAFDIGNHFSEYAGVEPIDYSLYPDENYQKHWLRVYLEEFLAPKPVTDEDVHRLYVQVNKFSLSAHFLWTIWALIQAENSTIDFDFLAFGKAHFDEYRDRREGFLAME